MYRYNKFNNHKVIIDGHEFDSEKEGNRYLELKSLEKERNYKRFTITTKVCFTRKIQIQRSSSKRDRLLRRF